MSKGIITMFTLQDVSLIVAAFAALVVATWIIYTYVQRQIDGVRHEGERRLASCRAQMQEQVDSAHKRIDDLREDVFKSFLQKDHFAESFSQMSIQMDGMRSDIKDGMTTVHSRLDTMYQFMSERGNDK